MIATTSSHHDSRISRAVRGAIGRTVSTARFRVDFALKNSMLVALLRAMHHTASEARRQGLACMPHAAAQRSRTGGVG
jgi:uncharacterized protein YbjQ (UPF0145 family)